MKANSLKQDFGIAQPSHLLKSSFETIRF